MFVGSRVGTRFFVGTSLGSLLFVGFLLLFGVVGMPIFIVMEIFKAMPDMTPGGWVAISLGAAVVIGVGVWVFRTYDPNSAYMSPEERAEILAQYPDPDEPVAERPRPNRLRQPH